MNDQIWVALALSRLAVRSEMLEQEVNALRAELEKSKGLRAVESPPEVKSDAT